MGSYDTATFDDRFDAQGRAKQKQSGKPQRLYRWEDAQRIHARKVRNALAIPPPLSLLPDPASAAINFAHHTQAVLNTLADQ